MNVRARSRLTAAFSACREVAYFIEPVLLRRANDEDGGNPS